MTPKQSITLLTCFLLSCGTDSTRHLALLEGEPGPAPVGPVLESRDVSAREARMNITLELDTFGQTELTPDQFSLYVAHACDSVILPTDGRSVEPGEQDYWAPCMTGPDWSEEVGASPNADPGCPVAYCRIQRKICEANMMLEFAAATAPLEADIMVPTLLGYPNVAGLDLNSGTIINASVPPQETESRAALAELAMRAATDAAVMASQNLTLLGTGSESEAAADKVPYQRVWQHNLWTPFQSANNVNTVLCTADPQDEADLTVGDLWSRPFTELPGRRPVDRPEMLQNSQTMAEAIATLMLEATNIAIESADLATQTHIDAADAEFSRNTDRADAAEQAWVGTTLSRARAAHLNVGGQYDGGLHYLWGQGVCPMSHLDNAGEAALDYFRQSAMDPRIIAGDKPIEAVLLGSNDDPFESLRGRLADRIPDASLASMDLQGFLEEVQLPLSAFVDARDYLKHEQRAFGRDPDVISPDLAVGKTADGLMPIYATPGYAATAIDPTIAPSMYYTGIARFPMPWDSDYLAWCPSPRTNYKGDVERCGFEDLLNYYIQAEDRTHHLDECTTDATCAAWEQCLPASDGVDRCFHVNDQVITPTGTYAHRSLSHLLDYAASIMHDLPRYATDYGGDLPANVADLLARGGLELSKQRPSRIETCYDPAGGSVSTPDQFRIRVMGVADLGGGDQFMVVADPSGLRCATEGNVEGVACDLNDYLLATADDYYKPSTRPVGMGFTDYSEVVVDLNLHTNPVDWLYVVQRREGAPRMQPGSYEGVGVVKVQRMTDDEVRSTWGAPVPTLMGSPPSGTTVDNWRWCSLSPVVPERTDLVARILAPNEDNCTAPNVTCAGFEFAERIPLENELTEDHDGIEDSWRHYLDVAMNAATAADALGEELIERGFMIDERIETATAEVEGVCGGAISIRDLAWGSLEDTRVGECSTDPNSCPVLYSCINGQCVKDLDATYEAAAAGGDEDAQAILDCVGDGEILPRAALADTPICIWRKPLESGAGLLDPTSDGYEEEFCQDPPTAVNSGCPFFATSADFATATCERPANLPADWKVEIVQDHLDIFTPQVGSGEPDSENDDLNCELIRYARRETDPAGAAVWAERISDQLRLNQSTAVGLVNRLGWTPYPGNHAAITVDEEIRWATGMPNVEGAEPYYAGGWPCDSSHPTVAEGFRNEACDNSANVASNPLFQSYACDCDDQASDVGGVVIPWARPAMTNRLGKAVIAAKIITGSSFSNVTLPFLPHLHSYVWYFDKDAEACNSSATNSCDYEKARWQWEEGSSVYNMFGGRVLETGSGFYFKYWGDGEDRHFYQDAEVFCHPVGAGSWSIWWDPILGDLAPDCSNRNRRYEPTGSDYPIIMRPAEDVTANPTAASFMWNGMDPDSVSQSAPGDTAGLIYRLLANPSERGQIVLSKASGVTNFFDQCLGSGSRANYGDHNCPSGIEEHYFNKLHMAPNGLTGEEVLDALELICEVGSEEGFGCDEVATAPPSSMQDLTFVRDAMECVANGIRTDAAMTVYRDVPRSLLPAEASPEAYQGERGAELSNLIGAFLQLNQLENNLAASIDTFAEDVDILRAGLRRYSVLEQLAAVEQESAMFDRLSACAASAARSAGGFFTVEGVTLNLGNAVMGAVASAVECGNAVQQVSLSFERLELQEQDLELQGDMAWADFRKRFIQTRTDINNTVDEINTVLHQIGGALAAAESHRQRARRVLGQGLMMTADAQGRTFATNAVMRARYNTVRIRYEQALRYAKYMSYMARRALEQRVGIQLMDIEDDMAFVDAPATWADEVCTFGGIDYGDISSGNLEEENYANAYIGDYVTKLHQVFESYSLDFPFHEGTDTAVVSVRDDIVMSRGLCEAEANNLLADSASLGAGSWSPTGCLEYDPDPLLVCTTPDQIDCLGTAPIVESCVGLNMVPSEDRDDAPIPQHHQALGGVEGFEVTFAPGITDPGVQVSSLDPGVTAYGQTVVLEPGTYRLSWRGRDPAAPGDYHPRDAVDAVERVETRILDPGTGDLVGTEVIEQDVVRSPTHTATAVPGWPLHFFVFEVAEDPGLPTGDLGAREVRIEIRSDSDPTALTEYSIEVAAFMLEKVSGEVSVASAMVYDDSLLPQAYAATTEAGIAMLPVCEDVDGTTFRQGWSYGCEKLCPGGYATCADGESQCYWQREVSLSLGSIEEQSYLTHAGFAYGNYNYRVDSLALNFVGTRTRDCSESSAPSACYGSGFIPYSIYHEGTYEVRNHLGEAYQAPLFRGVIEHAKGLAAERYVTNPISSADRTLLQDYVRGEFAGRPLPGRYVIRVWDQDGVNFHGIEDVQVVLNYRYWTRND